MSDAELDVVAIKHRHLLLLGEVHRIALARVFLLRATVKDGFLAGRLYDQFGLKDSGRVSQFLGLLLAVDEEEGDAPEVVSLADEALNLDLWELPIRGPVQPPGLQRDRLGDSLSLGSLPDQLLVAALGREGFAPIPVIVPPSSRDLEGLRFKADAERHPERRREHRLRCRGRRFGGPVLDLSTTPLGKLVELLG